MMIDVILPHSVAAKILVEKVETGIISYTETTHWSYKHRYFYDLTDDVESWLRENDIIIHRVGLATANPWTGVSMYHTLAEAEKGRNSWASVFRTMEHWLLTTSDTDCYVSFVTARDAALFKLFWF